MLDTAILWAHPVMQTLAALLGLLALWQGFIRFQMKRGKKIIFPWKKHVRFGTVALVLWTLGALGFYVTHTMFGVTHITGLHADLVWPIIALSLIGLVTGWVMDKYKKKRTLLPAAHGLCNFLLIVLVAVECYTGVGLIGTFL